MKCSGIVFYLLTSCCFLNAQNYFPGFQEQPIWQIHKFTQTGSTSFQIEVGSAVTICDQIWNPAINFENGNFEIIGYYRQIEDKVFFRHSNNCNDREYLLYDFSLEIGETAWCGFFPTAFNPADTILYRVANIGYYDYGGVTRKTLSVFFDYNLGGNSFNYFTYWVEGIGDINHPFSPAVCLIDNLCEEVFSVSCLTSNQSVIYSSINTGCGYNQNKFYVNTNVIGGENNGTSWSNAFSSLQDAIFIADYGDTIWVAQGIYYPTEDTNREKFFELKNGVAIYGGFNGTESHLNQRDYETNAAILSGDIGILNDSTDNSFHVVYGVDIDSTSLLDGVIIKEGNAYSENTSSSNHFKHGGGLYIEADTTSLVSPIFRNCIFENNRARNGGAVYCEGNNNALVVPVFQNCSFTNNSSKGSGGVLFHKNGSSLHKSLLFKDCVFENNYSFFWWWSNPFYRSSK